MSSWQLIFQQSKVNNGVYNGDRFRRSIGSGPGKLGFKPVCVISEKSAATIPRR